MNCNAAKWSLSLVSMFALTACASRTQPSESLPPDYSADGFRPGCPVTLAEGMHVESTAIVAETLQRKDGSFVRPVSVTIDFTGSDCDSRLEFLRLPVAESDQALSSSISVGPRSYLVDVRPRAPLHWADVRDSNDLVISVREGSLLDLAQSSDPRECAPVVITDGSSATTDSPR